MGRHLASWKEAYESDVCPHCGGQLDAPDEALDRVCGECRYTVLAADVVLEEIDD
jgi:DNA-directed RNA polymerase subunit RPC12/RpoP